jgi:uncharacterized delta-60 repeat protein
MQIMRFPVLRFEGQSLAFRIRLLTFGLLLGAQAGIGWAQSPAPDDFNTDVFGGQVSALAVQTDGRILVGGSFTTIAGQSRNSLARLNADGTVDEGFNPEISGPVTALALQEDGKILIGGGFTLVGGQARSGLARLNLNGALDAGFTPSPTTGGAVSVLALQTDRKILVGGSFHLVDGQPRNGLTRLEANGALDTNFNAGSGGGPVSALALQPDGKILVGGSFVMLGGQTREGIGRLNADGTLDSGFNTSASGGSVLSLAVQADGRILVGGSFTMLGGEMR